MESAEYVRPSRDGDQFHYVWAAQRAVRLLDPLGRMVMLAVEGTSGNDTKSASGEEVIDLAEYYGTDDVTTAEKVVYRQFKHSTVNDLSEWTASWMSKTLVGFAKKYAALAEEHPSAVERVTYVLTTNRPGRPEIHQALSAMRTGTSGGSLKANRVISYLSKLVSPIVGAGRVIDFINKFRVEDTERGLIDQRNELDRRVRGFLPGAPTDDYILLKEMIAIRATSEYAKAPFVTKHDVLAALKVTEYQLLPAPNLFSTPEHLLETGQIRDFAKVVTEQPYPSVVIGHATGGVGKSVLAHAFGSCMPVGSTTIVYDCFGNGTYRRPSTPRHEARHALVQICNELAAKGLCNLVLPSPTADDSDYFRIFHERVAQACEVLSEQEPSSLLTIAVDAADNSALVARDTGTKSFVTGFLREAMPTNCRLVLFSRTERLDLLDPPPTAARFKLIGFSKEETAQYLATQFPSALDADVAEFHRVTGGHPRAQAAALDSKTSVEHALRDLGGTSKTPEAIIYKAIHDAIGHAKDAYPQAPQDVDRLCGALAALRPMIPTHVLAVVAGVPEPLVHSFVSDLGRPLLIDSGAVQFRDEPTETWFHENWRPFGANLDEFLDRVARIAESEPYLATSLPDLLLEAGRVDALIGRALDLAQHAVGRQLSQSQSDLERYEIAQHTVQLALKGALRAGNELAGARLALNAGKLAAGHGRRLQLIRDNPDLASEFLDASLQEHLVATRALVGDWPGANLVSESAMLATAPGQRELARHHLRSAVDSTIAWVHRPSTDDPEPEVSIRDIADLAWGALNTDGPTACAHFLSRWKPLTIAFEAGLIISRRLGDAGRIDDLFALARGRRRPKHLKLAVAQSLWEYNINAPDDVVRSVISTLKRHRHPIELSGGRGYEYSDELPGLDGIIWLVALGFRSGMIPSKEAVRILDLYIQINRPSVNASWFRPKTGTVVRGLALRSHVNGTRLDADDIADPSVLEAKKRPYSDSQSVREHEANIVPLTHWTNLWASSVLGTTTDIARDYGVLRTENMRTYSDYDPPRFLLNAMPRLAVRILSAVDAPELSGGFATWCEQNAQFMSWPTLTEVVRVASGSARLRNLVPIASQCLRDSITAAHEESSLACEGLVSLARASYRFSASECRANFHEALEISEHAGDDLHERWRSFTVIGELLGGRSAANSERARRLLCVTEDVIPYTGDAIWVADPLAIAAAMSPLEAIAGASRWRDTRVADIEAISAAFTRPNGFMEASPTTALAFAPLGGRVPRLYWLAASIRSAPERGASIAKTFGDFERSTLHTDDDYAAIDSIASETGVDLSGTKYHQLHRAVKQSAPPVADTSSRWLFDSNSSASSAGQNGRNFSAGVDFRSPSEWDDALRSARGKVSRGSSDDIIDVALNCEAADLSDVLAGFRKSNEFTLFDCSTVLSRLESVTHLPFAIRGEVRALGEVILKRFARQLCCLRYEPLDLDTFARLTGWDPGDFVGAALRRLGELPGPLSSDEYYSLATRLSGRLDDDGLGTAFDECASLFRDVAPDESTQPHIEPASAQIDTVARAAAVFVWAALGDPRAEVRWRAAHTVVLLLQFGEIPFATGLLAAATDDRQLTGFVDPRVVFYRKHALQWLMFALARSSRSQSALVAVGIFEGLLRSVLFEHSPHVVIQESARFCVHSLYEAGLIQWTPSEMDRVDRTGAKLAVHTDDFESRSKRRVLGLTDLMDIEAGADELQSRIVEFDDADSMDSYLGDNESRYFLDFRDYWCDPLGDAFGLHRDAIERLVGDLVAMEVGRSSARLHARDLRHVLGFYKGSTHAYKSDWPENDDLDFYRAIHALCEIAGRLIRHLPVRRHYDDGDDEYDRFLRNVRLSRSDGRWLSDRRDPAPRLRTVGEFQESSSPDVDNWLFSIVRSDFEDILAPSSTTLRVWARREVVSRTRSLDSSVRSALVNPAVADAFLRAVRSASSTTPMMMPSATDYEASDLGRFSLKGWIDHGGESVGVDTQDPFASRIGYPPSRPCKQIVDKYGLNETEDLRAWTRDGRAVMQSVVWDERDEVGQGDMIGSAGDELTVDSEFLSEVLATEGRCLLVQVTIHPYSHHRRRGVRSPFHDDDGDPSYVEASTMYYAIREDGRRIGL